MLEDSDAWSNQYLGAGGPDRVLVASVVNTTLKKYEGKSIAQIAADEKKDPRDALIDIVVADRANTACIIFMMDEDDVRLALQSPLVAFCTDSGAGATDGIFSQEKSHPRGWASTARILGHYVRDEKVLRLEEAVRKMTSFPAEAAGLTDRGLVKVGFAADLVARRHGEGPGPRDLRGAPPLQRRLPVRRRQRRARRRRRQDHRRRARQGAQRARIQAVVLRDRRFAAWITKRAALQACTRRAKSPDREECAAAERARREGQASGRAAPGERCGARRPTRERRYFTSSTGQRDEDADLVADRAPVLPRVAQGEPVRAHHDEVDLPSPRQSGGSR